MYKYYTQDLFLNNIMVVGPSFRSQNMPEPGYLGLNAGTTGTFRSSSREIAYKLRH
jgi:hypothetical protein